MNDTGKNLPEDPTLDHRQETYAQPSAGKTAGKPNSAAAAAAEKPVDTENKQADIRHKDTDHTQAEGTQAHYQESKRTEQKREEAIDKESDRVQDGRVNVILSQADHEKDNLQASMRTEAGRQRPEPGNTATKTAGKAAEPGNTTSKATGKDMEPGNTTTKGAGKDTEPGNTAAKAAGKDAKPGNTTTKTAGKDMEPGNTASKAAGKDTEPRNTTSKAAGKDTEPGNTASKAAGKDTEPGNTASRTAGEAAKKAKHAKNKTSAARVREQFRRVMPLLRTHTTTAECMFFVILALLPAAGTGIYHYGVRAMFLIGLGVASAIVTELICDLIFRKGLTIFDYSAVVTGLIVGLLMPPSAPYRFPVIASAIAIFAAKMLFGGIGKNILNPAAAGKLVLLLFFPTVMADFSTGTYSRNIPLQEIQNGSTIRLVDMLTGNVSGCIGTTSVIAILIGVIFLVFTGIIDLQVSLPALISFTAFYFFFGQHGLSLYFICAQLCGGSLLFTFFFMANDYTTSPVGKRARIVDGVLLGIVTGLLRVFAGQEENACLYALLITNVVSRIFERRLIPRPFGSSKYHRTLRVHVPVPGEQEQTQKTAGQLAAQKSEADFREFEQSVLPQGAVAGSETAGTITQESINYFENRQRLDYGPAPYGYGYPQNGGYGYPQGGYAPGVGYPQSGGYGGYGSGAGYPQNGGYVPGAGFPQDGSYDPGAGYPQNGGYGSGGPGTGYLQGGSDTPGSGYPQDGSYTSGTGYPQGGGYAPGAGYAPDSDYAPGTGYAQNSGYAPGTGYAQDAGYAPGTGYPQNGGYVPAGAGYSQDGSDTPGAGYPQSLHPAAQAAGYDPYAQGNAYGSSGQYVSDINVPYDGYGQGYGVYTPDYNLTGQESSYYPEWMRQSQTGAAPQQGAAFEEKEKNDGDHVSQHQK